MEDLYGLIQERNARETLPFLSIHASHAGLRSHADALQARCESLERQYLEQQQLVATQAQAIESNANAAPAKTEARLRKEIAKLEMTAAAAAIEQSKEASRRKEERAATEQALSNLRMEAARNDEIVAHLQSELENSKSLARLAEQQFDGLKEAVRALQDENDEMKKLNTRLLDDRVSEKEKMAEQFNNMNDTIDTLQKEANMLRSYVKMGSTKKNWFGLPARQNLPAAASGESPGEDADANPTRRWGATGAVMPSRPLYTIQAHRDDASCLRYDGTNLNRVATASSDATVKVFDTSNGQLEATFSAGGSGQPLLGVDLAGDIVCGCGADKSCR